MSVHACERVRACVRVGGGGSCLTTEVAALLCNHSFHGMLRRHKTAYLRKICQSIKEGASDVEGGGQITCFQEASTFHFLLSLGEMEPESDELWPITFEGSSKLFHVYSAVCFALLKHSATYKLILLANQSNLSPVS